MTAGSESDTGPTRPAGGGRVLGCGRRFFGRLSHLGDSAGHRFGMYSSTESTPERRLHLSDGTEDVATNPAGLSRFRCAQIPLLIVTGGWW